MAIKAIVDEYKDLMKKRMSQIKKVSGLGDKVVLDLVMGGESYVKAIKLGAEPIILANNMPKQANGSKYWRLAVADAIQQIETSNKCHYVLNSWNNNITSRGIYLVKDKRRKNSIVVRFLKDDTNIKVNDNTVQKLAAEFRNIVYNKWIDIINANINDLFTGLTLGPNQQMSYKGGSKKISTQMGQNTNISHQAGTTVAQLAIQELRKSTPAVIPTLHVEILKVFDFAEQNMQISWGRSSKKNKIGSYTFDTKVNTKLEYNEKGSKQLADSKGMLQEFERATAEYIKTEITRPGSPLFGLTQKASKSIKQQIAEDVINDIVIPLTKGGKPDRRFSIVKKMTAKKFKAETRAPRVVKQAKGIGNLSQTATLSLSGKTVRGRPEKSKRTNQDNLVSLRALINKRLGAEVRRNMGRPALENRTGDFSNSVELMDLRETKGGISGAYTYTLTGGGRSKNRQGVYQTFENGGRWPEGYNPKPLISKSIRNLALQYTEQKFTSLRRT